MTAKYDKDGREIPDRTRIEVPLRYRNAPSMDQRVQQMLRAARIREQMEQEEETEADANDFSTDDPEEVRSMHEIDEAMDNLSEATHELNEAWERHKAQQPPQATPPKEEASDAT